MQSDRMQQMAESEARLAREKALSPHLFPAQTWADDNALLEVLGIHIPGKESFARGYLKLLPSDFIVEEMTQDGVQTYVSEEPSIPDTEGETVYATLVKCGLSTLEAVEELSKLLGTTKDKIQYAGIKDKDAITSQNISIRGKKKEEVEALQSPHFILKNIHTGKGVVMKGGLKSNRFSILIRIGEDKNDDSRMKSTLAAIEKVKKDGFYNFFYLQRFGTPRLNNYKWGMNILRGDYEKAVRGIISDLGLREIPFFLEMRKEMSALLPDWKAILDKFNEFPLIFPSEIKVLEHLVKKPGDFLGALLQVEEQVVLWVSAVASLLYNRRISSYLMAGIEPPLTLPLFLSTDRNDWLPYAEDLEGAGLFPPDFNNVRSFRNLSLLHRDIKTKDQAEVHSAEIVDEGIIVNFSLGKGEYATTFLSHFVTLLGGEKPEDISEKIIDLKKELGEKDIQDTLEYFKDLNVSKSN